MARSQLEANKREVTEFYSLMVDDCRPKEAIDRYALTAYE